MLYCQARMRWEKGKFLFSFSSSALFMLPNIDNWNWCQQNITATLVGVTKCIINHNPLNTYITNSKCFHISPLWPSIKVWKPSIVIYIGRINDALSNDIEMETFIAVFSL